MILSLRFLTARRRARSGMGTTRYSSTTSGSWASRCVLSIVSWLSLIVLSFDPAWGRRRGDRHPSDDMIDTGLLFLSLFFPGTWLCTTTSPRNVSYTATDFGLFSSYRRPFGFEEPMSR